MRIEVLSGSPRSNSVTRRLARHLTQALQQQTGHEVGMIDLEDWDLPPVKAVFTSVQDAPDQYKPVAERMFAAEAFVLVTPEYNGSYTSELKNLLDHFPKQTHKTFAIATASPGALGGIRAAMQMQQLIFALFGIGSPYMLITPQVDKKFSPEGELLDLSFQKSIDIFIKEFLWLAEKLTVEKVPV